MKKILSVILALISTISLAFAFGACGEESGKQNNEVNGSDQTHGTGKEENGGETQTNKQDIVTGTFYTVTEAYELGYLTREDVMSIAYYHNGGNYMNEDIMDEYYAPLPMTPERLSAEDEKALINSFYNSDSWGLYEDNFTKDDISYWYLGTHGNVIAVKIGVKGEAVSEVVWKEIIDGVTIYYRNGKRILIWDN